jgi:hypothetical protein
MFLLKKIWKYYIQIEPFLGNCIKVGMLIMLVGILGYVVNVFFAWQTVDDLFIVSVCSIEKTPSFQIFDVDITSKKPFVGAMYLKVGDSTMQRVDGLMVTSGNVERRELLYNQDSRLLWYNCLHRVRVRLICMTNGDVSILDSCFNSELSNNYKNRSIIKKEEFESSTIRWIVSPMGSNRATHKLYENVSCSIVEGIGAKNHKQCVIMCGAAPVR